MSMVGFCGFFFHRIPEWATWWALDGPDTARTLRAMDTAGKLNMQVDVVQNVEHVHSSGISSFQCFLRCIIQWDLNNHQCLQSLFFNKFGQFAKAMVLQGFSMKSTIIFFNIINEMFNLFFSRLVDCVAPDWRREADAIGELPGGHEVLALRLECGRLLHVERATERSESSSCRGTYGFYPRSSPRTAFEIEKNETNFI